MKIHRLRSLEDYKQHAALNQDIYQKKKNLEDIYSKSKKEAFTISGFSYPATQNVDFVVDYQYSNDTQINWRERVVCPITKLNNRLRCCIHLMDIELGMYPSSPVFISEKLTPLYSFLEKKYTNMVGSEYMGESFVPGSLVKGVRHEDMTDLSFSDEQFKYYLSFECLEHIPKYQKVIPEIFRTLQEGGTFFGSFPFDRNKHEHTVKAEIGSAGEIIYHSTPEYHGDPVNGKGILCYTIFGWQIIEDFLSAGFKDAYAIFTWSDIFGYLGDEQVFFVAKK